jgi:hypothetical protein
MIGKVAVGELCRPDCVLARLRILLLRRPLEGASRRSGAVMSSQKAETSAEKSICVKRRKWERWADQIRGSARVCETLRIAFGISCFVETGTFHGRTASWAAERSERVITIELLEPLYRAAAVLAQFSNVTAIHGGSLHALHRRCRLRSSGSMRITVPARASAWVTNVHSLAKLPRWRRPGSASMCW